MRKRLTEVAVGTLKPLWTQLHQVHWSPRVRRSWTNETEVDRVTDYARRTKQGDPVHGRHRKTLSGFQAHHHYKFGNGQAGIGRKDGGLDFSNQGMLRSPNSQHSRSADPPDRGTNTHNTLVNGCQLLVQHSTFTVVSGTSFRCACTQSARGTGIQRWEESLPHNLFCTVLVVRARARLLLLVRWLCAVDLRA